MKEIKNAQDVHELVHAFYEKVLKDELLAPFFTRLNFDEHLPKMEFFWRFVLLDEVGYTTNVTDKHMHLRLSEEHFKQWLHLFNATIDERFIGEKAEMARQRAALIGWTIQSKM